MWRHLTITLTLGRRGMNTPDVQGQTGLHIEFHRKTLSQKPDNQTNNPPSHKMKVAGLERWLSG